MNVGEQKCGARRRNNAVFVLKPHFRFHVGFALSCAIKPCATLVQSNAPMQTLFPKSQTNHDQEVCQFFCFFAIAIRICLLWIKYIE